jgi:hypothetical protein
MHPWYYAEAGQQHGPISKEDLQSKLGAGTLTPDALVWTEGMPEWKPANSISGLWDAIPRQAPPLPAPGSPPASVSPYAPPAASLSDVDWNAQSTFLPEGPQIRPWVRYWARTLDFLIFCLVVGVAAAIVTPELLESTNDTLLTVVLLAVYNLYEPAWLAIFGATPFKALLRIRVKNQNGSKLSYGQALRRTMIVWFAGQGLGIPIAALITNIHSYNKLTQEGITSWDRSGQLTVIHKPVEWWRWLCIVAVFVAFIGLVVLGSQA